MQCAGMGRDANGMNHRGFRVVKVERVEYAAACFAYSAARANTHSGDFNRTDVDRPVGDPRGPGRGPTLARGGRSANAAATAMAATPAKAKAMGGKASAGGGSGLYSADQVLY